MKQFKYFPIFFILVFCTYVVLQKFNFLIRGIPVGGHSWAQIINDLPLTIIFAIICAIILNYIFSQLNKMNKNDIDRAKKRMEDRVKFRSPMYHNGCRICGYNNEYYPWGEDGKSPTFQICPCCGEVFGKNDLTIEDIRLYREKWERNGVKWYDKSKKPKLWNKESQLKNIPKEFL